MQNWKDISKENEEAKALAQLLSPLQVLALHKALSPLVSQAKGLLPSGQHPCTIKVQGEGMSYLVAVSEPRKDTLLPVPYKAVATTALCRLNAATVASICKDAEDRAWKGETSTAVEVALKGAAVARDKWRKGSIIVTIDALSLWEEGPSDER